MRDEFGGITEEKPLITFSKILEERGKVIPFPSAKVSGRKRTPLPTTAKGWTDKLKDYKIKFANFIIERHVNVLGEKLAFEGIDVTGQEYAKDIFLIAESVRSLLYRRFDLKHNFQAIADDMVVPINTNKKKTTPKKPGPDAA